MTVRHSNDERERAEVAGFRSGSATICSEGGPMQARMKNHAVIIPEAMQAIQALQAAIHKANRLSTGQVAAGAG
jgi:hypothetical protein